jgi:hypothetical protein
MSESLINMSESLIEFWKRCEFQNQPYVHQDDREALQKRGRWIKEDATDFSTYIAHPRFGRPDDDQLHLSLLPVPYVGDLVKAELVILLLNPGFDYSDYWAETMVPDFRSRLIETTHQSLASREYPFWALDPSFCWHTGFMWWERRLREVIQQIAASKFGGSYKDALRDLSGKLACVELIPYHSASFRDHRLIEHLPSVMHAKNFVLKTLLPEAKVGKRTLIVTRRAGDWGLKDEDNVIVYGGGHTRGASLSPRSRGGKAILRRYGLA